jgi:hypothetical protein
MTQNELLADGLSRNLEMLKSTLADFSDADMLVRPVPSANHAAWQLGHLINSESGMLNGVRPGSAPTLPAGFAEKFKRATAGVDDAAFFPKKAELLETLSKVRAVMIDLAKSVTPSEMNQPTPEKMHQFAPTVAHVFTMAPMHTMMHIGQFQVIRRKLQKPILF